VIPEIPETVMEELERRHFVRTLASKKAKERRRMSSQVTIEEEALLYTKN
jgi:hypothetical protein